VSFGVTEFLLCMVVILLIATLSFVFLFIQTMRDPVSLRRQQGGKAPVPPAAKPAHEAAGSAGALAAMDTDAKAATVLESAAISFPARLGVTGPAEHTRLGDRAATTPTELQSGDDTSSGTIQHMLRLFRRHAVLLGLLVCLSFVQNGAMVAVLPYAAAPLDPRAPESGRHWQQLVSSNPGIVLQWTNTCGLLADPLGALLTLLPACQRAPPLRSGLLVGVWVVALLVVLGLALAGPYAQWGGSEAGAIALAAVYTMARFAMGLQRAQLFLVARGGGFGSLESEEGPGGALESGDGIADWPAATRPAASGVRPDGEDEGDDDRAALAETVPKGGEGGGWGAALAPHTDEEEEDGTALTVAEEEEDGTALTVDEEEEDGTALTVAEEERRDAAVAIAGERVSLLAGAATQLGACAGSLLFAILVTDTNVFHQHEDTGL
jgi:hypothetical protein